MTHLDVQELALVKQRYCARPVPIPVRIYLRIGSARQMIYGMYIVIAF